MSKTTPAVLSLALLACGGAQTRPDTWVPPDTAEAAGAQVDRSVALALAEAEVAWRRQQLDCRALSWELTVCPTELALEGWAWEHHLREPLESDLTTALEPPDPVPVRDGLEVYQTLLEGVARRTVTHLELFEHTPIYSDTEIDWFAEHPTVWERNVRVRGTPAGRARREALREAVNGYEDDPIARRHLVLRDHIFYFEDPATASWASSHLRLRDLFEEPTIVLERDGTRYELERGRSGHYYHTDDERAGYRARLSLLDRVGLEDEMAPPSSYGLRAMRRRLGIDWLEVGAESGAGRAGRAHLLDGSAWPARLVRAERGLGQLGVVGPYDEVASAFAASASIAEAVWGIIDTTAAMVREDLFFDEPANEVGQQDGIMRLAFNQAYRHGELEYTVNEVTYPIFDRQGRARPPQVCIDFVTDAVERWAGRWWPPIEASANRRTVGRIHIGRVMRYRQVRRLLEIADLHPGVAWRYEVPGSLRVAFEERGHFYANLFQLRERFRLADVVVIYGLRADELYHYHSFYVFDTDPLHGMPIALADQAGHARVRSWNQVMRTAPLRYVRARVRWNPAWLWEPAAVYAAGDVVLTARAAAEAAQAGGGSLDWLTP